MHPFIHNFVYIPLFDVYFVDHSCLLIVGQAMLFELERSAKRQGMTAIVLDAREHAVRFYLKNGYVVTGDSYLLFGEIPHSKMEKQLNGSA